MNDDEIRTLLDDAVSDVEPRPGLEAIRTRTNGGRAHRPWLWASGGAVLATAATVAVVAALGSGPRTPAADPDPGFAGSSSAAPGSATPEPTQAPPTETGLPAQGTRPNQPVPTTPDGRPTQETQQPAPSGQAVVPVYFVGDTSHGPRLFREFHSAPAGDHELDRAVEDAVTGAAADADYSTPWPTGTTMERAQLSEGVLSVDLSGPVTDRPEGMSDATARLALQQVVYTAQGVVQDRIPVTFLVGGRPAPTLLGVPVSDGVAQAAADDVLAQVWVTTPAEGSTVGNPFTVEGVAAAFEANVQWELRRGDTVVERGFATAQECCTMSPYSFTVEAAPGTYTLVVHDEDASGGEGLAPWQDTKNITVE